MTQGRRREVLAWLGTSLALSALSGCAAALQAPADEVRKELLDKLPPGLPQRQSAVAGAMLVFPPQTAPVYDTKQIAYMLRPHEVAYFSQHEWAEPPSRMLLPLLVRALQDSHGYSAVLTPPYAGRYGYALRTEIRELVADYSAQPAALQLSLRFQLSDGAGRVIASKDLLLREQMQQSTPYAAVAAANDAVAKALLDLVGWVLEQAR